MSAMVAGAIGNPDPLEQPSQEVATDEGYADKDETYREVFCQPGLKAEPREHRDLRRDCQPVSDYAVLRDQARACQ